jgi:hypothetical protein
MYLPAVSHQDDERALLDEQAFFARETDLEIMGVPLHATSLLQHLSCNSLVAGLQTRCDRYRPTGCNSAIAVFFSTDYVPRRVGHARATVWKCAIARERSISHP